MPNGKPLSRAFMISRTAALMAQAKIKCLDPTGKPIKLVAASWRAGHVLSGLDCNFDEAYIKAAGQWTSDAWTSYADLPLATLSHAVDAMAREAYASSASSLSASGWASSEDVLEPYRCVVDLR